jgi:hypothetical protein
LWGTNSDQNSILTNPVRSNNNKIKLDDFYKVENDYSPNEPIRKHNNRAISINMDIWKLKDDEGYEVIVSVWQASKDQILIINDNLYNSSFLFPVKPLVEDKRIAKVGQNLKEEKFSIALLDVTSP